MEQYNNMEPEPEKYEYVNHPKHYNKYDVEVIDMIERIFGKKETAIFCKITAYRYRMRMGEKPDNPIEQDIAKENWYLNKYHSLKDEIETMEKINNTNYTTDYSIN